MSSRESDIFPLHARQPINADGSASGVAPELDELLDGEDTGQVLDRSAVLGVSALKLRVCGWVAGDPANVGNAYDIAVQVSYVDVMDDNFDRVAVINLATLRNIL